MPTVISVKTAVIAALILTVQFLAFSFFIKKRMSAATNGNKLIWKLHS
jgi:hypothetical protein